MSAELVPAEETKPARRTLSVVLADMSRFMMLVEDYFERGEDVPEDLFPVFSAIKGELAASVDRRVAFFEGMKDLITRLDREKVYFSTMLARAERLLAQVEDHTKRCVSALPERKAEGTWRKLCVVDNGGAALVEWRVKLGEVKNVLPSGWELRIPEDFIEFKKVAVLKKAEFEAALRTGVLTSELAHVLPRGTHLRVR